MDKSKLDGFIKRYNLNGCVESVKIVSSEDDNKLKTSFISEEKHILGNVELKNENFGDYEMGVLETGKLKQLLGVLNSEIDVDTVTSDDRVISLGFSDKNTKVNYMLSDTSVIPKVPIVKQLPDWDVVLLLNKDFMNRFIKAKNALPDVNTFTLLMNKKTQKLDMIIGYASINSNRIALDITPEDGKDTVGKPISFAAKYFKELLSANSEATDAKLYVSSKGLAYIKFDTEEYISEYFLTEVEQSD